MKIVRKVAVPFKEREYCGWEYLWETKTHIFATQIDIEGYAHTEVHALTKIVWTIQGRD